MKYRPETDQPLEGVPSADPGRYTMQIRQYRENQKIQKTGQTKDVIDFVGDNPEGITVGSALWISGPSIRPDGSTTKGNVWQYRRLAEAIGPDAVARYHETDAEGFSLFSPKEFIGRWVLVTVGQYGVDSVEAADPAIIKAKTPRAMSAEEWNKPPASFSKGSGETSSKVADDDIPF